MRPSPYGRPIAFGGNPGCDHDLRVLRTLIDAIGRPLVADYCLRCRGRTAWISRRDLEAVGVAWPVRVLARRRAP